MKAVHVIGVMSGTSCDGVSAALIRCTGGRPRVRVVASALRPFPATFRRTLLSLAQGMPAPAALFATARAALAQLEVKAVQELLRRSRVPARRIACLGSHGHTLFHAPRGVPPTTWQADDLALLAERTGMTAIGDFRSRDVAAGGEGAPLAPWAHRILYAHAREHRLILNLGGIANVTWLPAGGFPGAVRAFDTGPANLLMDALASRRGVRFDAGGRLAARGRAHEPALRRWLAHAYFRRRPPKSTGREVFGARLLPALRGLSAANALATASEFTARSVADQIARWLPHATARAAVYVGGGGARNPDLMRRFNRTLAPRPVRPLDRLGIRAQDVEAVCFALLAWARLRGKPNVLPAVTGARRAVSAGVICPA